MLVRTAVACLLTLAAGALPAASYAQPVRFVASGPARPLPLVGFNNNVLTSPLEAPAYRDTLATLRPQLLRYPGGTVGDYFDWRTGWVDRDALPPDHPWRTLEERALPPETMLAHFGAVGARPFVSLNAFSSTLTREMALLRRLGALGAPVTHVELGNEYNFEFPQYAQRYPTAEDYGTAMIPWIDSLRVAAPGARVCVIGSSPSPSADERRRTWNARLFPLVGGADAACFHPYFSADAALLARPEPLPALMAVVHRRWQAFQADELAALPAGWEAWLTEYNLFAQDVEGVRTTWSHGLMTALYSLLLMQDARVTVLLPHQTAGGPSFAAIETVAPFGAPQPYPVTAYGAAMRFVFETLGDATHGQPLAFSPAPQITISAGGGAFTYPQLVGWQVGPADVLLINAGTGAVDVDPAGLAARVQVRHLYADAPLTPGVTAADLRADAYATPNAVTLPPLSITRLTAAPSTRTSPAEPAPAPALQVTPSPAAGAVRFRLYLAQPAPVHLAVYDGQGRQVATVLRGPLSSGTHVLPWDAALAPGLYVAVAQVGAERLARPFVRIR